jgi:hypothetical protein
LVGWQVGWWGGGVVVVVVVGSDLVPGKIYQNTKKQLHL